MTAPAPASGSNLAITALNTDGRPGRFDPAGPPGLSGVLAPPASTPRLCQPAGPAMSVAVPLCDWPD
jgi:hypothetical protein